MLRRTDATTFAACTNAISVCHNPQVYAGSPPLPFHS